MELKRKLPAPQAPKLIVLEKRTGRLVADGKGYMPTPKGLFVLAAGREKNLLAASALTCCSRFITLRP